MKKLYAQNIITAIDLINHCSDLRITVESWSPLGRAADLEHPVITRVAMYCLEARNEMPALDEEIEEALEEDIVINNSWGPKRIISKDGKVTGIELKKCVSVFDKDKKFNPKYDENKTITVDADFVLLSVGQSIDWGGLLTDAPGLQW